MTAASTLSLNGEHYQCQVALQHAIHVCLYTQRTISPWTQHYLYSPKLGTQYKKRNKIKDDTIHVISDVWKLRKQYKVKMWRKLLQVYSNYMYACNSYDVHCNDYYPCKHSTKFIVELLLKTGEPNQLLGSVTRIIMSTCITRSTHNYLHLSSTSNPSPSSLWETKTNCVQKKFMIKNTCYFIRQASASKQCMLTIRQNPRIVVLSNSGCVNQPLWTPRVD